MRGVYVQQKGAAMGLEAFLPVAFIIGYLLGSIPFGLVLTKLAGPVKVTLAPGITALLSSATCPRSVAV